MLPGQPLHPLKHALQIFTYTSKEGSGAHLNKRTAREAWSLQESKLHRNHLELKAVFLALKEFQDICLNNIVLVATDYSGWLYKQRIGDEVGPSVFPSVENPDLVYQKTGNSQSPTHPRPAEYDSRLTIQTRPVHSNRMVPSPKGLPSNMSPVAPAPSGPVCHQVQQEITTICFSGSIPQGLDSYTFPPAAILGNVVEKLQDYPCNRIILIAPGWPIRPWFWDLVAMSSQIPLCLPNLPSLVTQPFNQTLHRESIKPEPICLAPRATAIKEQGFSEAVAARIEAPHGGSTRSVYEAKWAIFTKWCLSNQVDFRAPPLKAIAAFLLYLCQDRKLQLGTIDGYRSAIADKLGIFPINVSKDENLTRLLDSFHRDRPKGRRDIPSWNLSLVLHQLTKAPFEPMKEASLKHLTFKTIFLLALGSGTRRSEIHAWLHKNIRHQSDLSKVSLYPSSSFLSKNQLAKEGPDSVAPVVVPALAPTLDKSLKGDRSLCPVKALHYYLLRQELRS